LTDLYSKTPRYRIAEALYIDNLVGGD